MKKFNVNIAGYANPSTKKMGCCGKRMNGGGRMHHLRSIVWIKGKAVCRDNPKHPNFRNKPRRKKNLVHIPVCTANDRGRNLF